jgi:hypothetical protein
MSTQKTTKTRNRKSSNKRMYFGPEVDISIAKYNLSEDFAERSLIYQREIRPAFEKLVENIIHTFKFYYTDNQTLAQVQHEVVSFLVEKLSKFKPTSGKAFSYFSIVAKNYCILRNKSNYKKLTSHDSLAILSDDIAIEHSTEDEQGLSIDRFIDQFVEHWDTNLEVVFQKKSDRQLAAAVVELFRKRESIELFNKKALYIYIREMSNANTQQITKMLKVFKGKYKEMYKDFLSTGCLNQSKIY